MDVLVDLFIWPTNPMRDDRAGMGNRVNDQTCFLCYRDMSTMMDSFDVNHSAFQVKGYPLYFAHDCSFFPYNMSQRLGMMMKAPPTTALTFGVSCRNTIE